MWRGVDALPGGEYRSTLPLTPYPKRLTLPNPVAVLVLAIILHDGHPALVLVEAGAAAPQQPVHGPVARRQLDVPVPGALEDRQLRARVEVLPSARLVAVRLVPVLDQHFLQRRDEKQPVRREGGRALSCCWPCVVIRPLHLPPHHFRGEARRGGGGGGTGNKPGEIVSVFPRSRVRSLRVRKLWISETQTKNVATGQKQTRIFLH